MLTAPDRWNGGDRHELSHPGRTVLVGFRLDTHDEDDPVTDACTTQYDPCMTMLSFRVDDALAAEAKRWADVLGVDRSELLRDALHAHLVRLASERDADAWEEQPLSDAEAAIAKVADWGPAEDWSDWSDAAG